VSVQNPHLRAALLMLGSTLFFGAMAVTIRLASDTLSTYQIAFFRNFFGLIALLPFLWRSGPGVLRTRQLPRYLLRSAIGVASMLCGFWAIGHLPMAQAVSLSYSTPLFVTIAAVVFLQEKVRMRRWSAVVIGFIGVLVIVQPGSATFSGGTLVALSAAVLSGIVAIQIKQLSRIDSADTIVLYTYLFWVPLSLIPALFSWQWPHGIAWLWVVTIGIFGTGGQLLWTRALKLGDVSALTPISFMQLPLVSVAAWLLFDEDPSRWTILGAAIIFAANIYIAHREVQLARRAATTAPIEAAKPGE
jgi:drug/metabolite transporter (DMT)-like permease